MTFVSRAGQLPTALDATALSDVLVELDPHQLAALAKWLMAAARFAQSRAAMHERARDREKESRQKLDDLKLLPEAVAAMMLGGLDERSARLRVAFDHKIDVRTVDHYCNAKDRARASFTRQARALKIARLYAQGRSAAEIAKDLVVSRRTVERVLARLKRPSNLTVQSEVEGVPLPRYPPKSTKIAG